MKRFGDLIFPALASVGSVRRGPAENFYALLQLLVYLYEGQVDYIYIDPPYNRARATWQIAEVGTIRRKDRLKAF